MKKSLAFHTFDLKPDENELFSQPNIITRINALQLAS